MKISGVYKITNKITGEFYIGSSKNIKQRWSAHKSPSTWKGHQGVLLYQAFQQYGLKNFDFEIIEETNKLHEREQYFIDLLKPEYNIRVATIGTAIEEYKKQYQKQYQRQYQKQYNKSEKGRNVNRKKAAKYLNKLCSYNDEILTLNALYQRFYRAGIEQPVIEAKMYLIENN